MCWCTPSIRTPRCGKTSCLPPAQQPAKEPCPLCEYLHGHAIGCENNPVEGWQMASGEPNQ